MKLFAGERIEWPTTNFSTTQDHLLGALHGVPFIRIKANLVLPGLTPSAIQKLKLELIATQENDYIDTCVRQVCDRTQERHVELM